MAYGLEVIAHGVSLRLDSTYENMVVTGIVTQHLEAGYSVVSLANYANSKLVVAVKHPGASCSFLGYTYSGSIRIGVKIYSNTGGIFHFACFSPFYPLTNVEYGAEVYDTQGVMRFHSGLTYMDVVTSGLLSIGPVSTYNNYYILSIAAHSSFRYKVIKWIEPPSHPGGWSIIRAEIRCTKSLGYVWYSENGVISQSTVLLINNSLVKKVEKYTMSPNDSAYGGDWPNYDDIKGWVPPANAAGSSVVIVR